jgi:hypothetical protein
MKSMLFGLLIRGKLVTCQYMLSETRSRYSFALTSFAYTVADLQSFLRLRFYFDVWARLARRDCDLPAMLSNFNLLRIAIHSYRRLTSRDAVYRITAVQGRSIYHFLLFPNPALMIQTIPHSQFSLESQKNLIRDIWGQQSFLGCMTRATNPVIISSVVAFKSLVLIWFGLRQVPHSSMLDTYQPHAGEKEDQTQWE